jgi:hypothetical protein
VNELPRYLDGPRLVEWLEAEGLVYIDEDDRRSTCGLRSEGSYCTAYDMDGRQSFMRRFSEWRSGSTASVYTVDEFLIARGRHLSELPDDLYVSHRRATVESGVRSEAVALYAAGVGPREVGRRLGVNESSVDRWARRAGLPYQKPQVAGKA